MMSRVRCSCGRIYDPGKNATCPDCGAESPVESIVVAEKAKPPSPPPLISESESKAEALERGGVQRPAIGASLLSLPWPVYAGAAVLVFLVLFFALRSRSPEPKQASKDAAQNILPSDNTASPAATPEQSRPSDSAAPGATTSPGNPTFPPSGMPGTLNGVLSDLIAKAGANGTVRLKPGVYQGGAAVVQPVHIVGESGGQVFVQSDTKEAIAVRSKGVSLQGVQIMFAGTGETPAVSVADNAELELDGVKITSNSSYGLTGSAGAAVKAGNSTFSTVNGYGVQLDRQARGIFTQCNFTDSQTGLKTINGSTVELHSCAFERNGARTGRGAVIEIVGDKTSVSAEQCRFASNPAGLLVSEGAVLSLVNCLFKENGISTGQGNTTAGLVEVSSAAVAKFDGDTFDSNSQGINATRGGTVDLDKCRFTGTGLQTRGELIFSCMAVSANGQGTTATIRNSSITGSASYLVGAVGGARMNLEQTEISGARTVGLLVGDRNSSASTVDAKHCHFLRNTTGIGVCAGSSATIADSECRENSEGALALDRGTRLSLTRTTITGNRSHGVYVYGGAVGDVVDSEIQNNARGAQTGMPKNAAMSAALTLQKCRVAGNQSFGVGACTKSELTLTGVTFEANGKNNIYKESGAIVHTDGVASGQSEASADNPSNEGSSTKSRKRRPDDDPRRIIRRIFRP